MCLYSESLSFSDVDKQHFETLNRIKRKLHAEYKKNGFSKRLHFLQTMFDKYAEFYIDSSDEYHLYNLEQFFETLHKNMLSQDGSSRYELSGEKISCSFDSDSIFVDR